MNPNLKGLDIPAEVFEALELRSAVTGVDKTDLVVEALRQNLDFATTVERLVTEIDALKANDQKLEVAVFELGQRVDSLARRFAALKAAIEHNTEIAQRAKLLSRRAITQSRTVVAQARLTRQAATEIRQQRSRT